MSSCSDCCDVCESCTSCNGTCDTCQSFCELGHQLASDHGLSNPMNWVEKDDIIIETFPRSDLNEAIDYVISACRIGTDSGVDNQGQISSDWSTSHETRDFIYADKINELKEGIESLGGGTSVGSGPWSKDTDIIYASYFQDLYNALDGLKLNWNACDDCDTDCNVSCDTCNTCDTCEDSNSYWPSSWYGSWSGSWSGSDAGGA
jgi:hypothetical protein